MARRSALAVLLAAVFAAAPLRAALETPARQRPCAPEGRGDVPRHWLGCPVDPGPRRALADDERLVLGLPLDPNTAGARELAFVPGLSRRLAAALVEDRRVHGPYTSARELLRVRGIGPARLEAALPHLRVPPP